VEEVLIDTSVWILSFHRQGHENLKSILKELISADRAVMTGMVWLELLQGAKSEPDAKQLATRLKVLPRKEAGENIWSDIALLYRSLRRKGMTIPIPDLWIAQVAMQYDLVLMHCDRDYESIARYSTLKTMYFG